MTTVGIAIGSFVSVKLVRHALLTLFSKVLIEHLYSGYFVSLQSVHNVIQDSSYYRL